jgi:two-component system response regulator TctD
MDIESNYKVLIVDVDKDITSSLLYALDYRGFQITCCENSAEALLNSLLGEFHFIVVTYETHGMNGIELTRLLRRGSPRAFIIGLSNENMKEAFLSAGANDFLRKPFVPHNLAMMIDHWHNRC